MRYRCLVFDHDDTTVSSTASIHYPCFAEFLALNYPDKSCTVEEYFLKNFDPGFVQMCREDYGMDDEMLTAESAFWREYVKSHVPLVYPGIREIMLRQRREGGLICVVSHSYEENILRDYRENDLPMPDAIFGWDYPSEKRKPNPYPLHKIMDDFSLDSSDILMIDDLKPGYDMAATCGVDFAAALWGYDIEPIERFMRENCECCFKTTKKLYDFLFE